MAAFDLAQGEQCALEGRSGSGKSTFLNLIAGLLVPDAGTIELDGQRLDTLSEPARDAVRAERLGYVFQSFHLLPALTAQENVQLSGRATPAQARELLLRVGLEGRLGHKPGQLSVGQRQRVAVARALAGPPRLVLADEPTGNLDPETASAVLELIRSLCREAGSALLLVSHSPSALAGFERRERI